MPVMDGQTSTRAMREFEQSSGKKHTPIIALTGYTMREEIEKALSAGCDINLSKPIEKKVLVEAVQNALETSSQKKAA